MPQHRQKAVMATFSVLANSTATPTQGLLPSQLPVGHSSLSHPFTRSGLGPRATLVSSASVSASCLRRVGGPEC